MIGVLFVLFTCYIVAGVCVVMFDLTNLRLTRYDFNSGSLIVILYVVILWPFFVKFKSNDRN